MSEQPITVEGILKGQERLTPDDEFTFHCGQNLECFTSCCRDVSIVLTPFDILRLKRAMRMDSSEFLEKHTLPLFGSHQKFPLVILRMDAQNKRCPFVSDQGCRVYADRPWACRMYPLGVAKPQNPTPTDQPFYFVLHEQLCQGHGQGKGQKVRDWIAEQGIDEYEMMGASFQELALHDFWNREAPLSAPQAEMFHMACYDLDRFRRFVFESRFLQLFEIDEARAEALRRDDEELWELALLWLRFSLFGEKTMKVRADVLEARRQAAAQGSANVTTGSPT